MTQGNVHRTPKVDYAVLLLVLILAFYIAFVPHHNYPYPIHLDEWTHLACSNQIIKQAGVVSLTDPFSGGAPIHNQAQEVGFHLFWAVFHQISGIPWPTIFRYFPSIIFMFTVLSVYVLGQRQGFGWEAALFAALIPTTVGILGPAFMVPTAMGLLFIPLSLFIAFNFRSWWSYIVLLIFAFLLMSVHAATAVGLITILVPYILLNLKGNFRHSVAISLALAIPFLISFVSFPWVFKMVLWQAKLLLIPQSIPAFVDVPRITHVYGYLPILFCLLGTFFLAAKGGNRNYGLVLGLLALLVMLAIFFTFHYGIAHMYYRGLVYMMLMVSIVAGAGLMGVRKLTLPTGLSTRLKIPATINKNIGNVLCLVLIGITLATCIPVRQNIPYYHMIDDEDYEAFVWITENIGSDYEKAILDPWKATAFTAITGKYIYTRIGEYPTDIDEKAYSFLRGGCEDTTFLRENGISIIYTRWECHNPDLKEVRKNIYLLKKPGEPEQSKF